MIKEINMNQVKIGYKTGLLCLCIAIASALAGCVGISKSPAPRFYALKAGGGESQAKKYDAPANLVVGIGPVKVPEYLNRPQIVTALESNRLNIAEFDRWGETLDLALPRVIAGNLAILLPKTTIETSPWNLSVPVKYQVLVTVTRLECSLDKEILLAAQWSLLDLETRSMVASEKSLIVRPVEPQGYAGLAAALSSACAALSGEIAGRLATLPSGNEKPAADAGALPRHADHGRR